MKRFGLLVVLLAIALSIVGCNGNVATVSVWITLPNGTSGGDDHTNIREGMISSVESDGQKATLKYDKIDKGANTVTVTLTCASGATISKTVSVGTPKTIECDDGTTATVNIKEIK